MAPNKPVSDMPGLDMTAKVGSVTLSNPVMTASGTAGYSDELSGYMDLSALGAVVTKSLSPFAWNGNPPPRLLPTEAGMLNSVGLQNPGVSAWREHHLPQLVKTGASVVASIWGRTIDDYKVAASELAGADIIAVEANISCPNLESSNEMFAHSPSATASAISAVVEGLASTGTANTVSASTVPVWAKLSPNATDIVAIARSALDAGASAVTLTNTLMAIAIDPEQGKPVLGNVAGGLSGLAVRPVALRAVYDVRAALGPVPIIGVGGIFDASHAVEFLSAGANAVQVGTATFADPRAPQHIAKDLAAWCSQRNIHAVSQLIGRAHESHEDDEGAEAT